MDRLDLDRFDMIVEDQPEKLKLFVERKERAQYNHHSMDLLILWHMGHCSLKKHPDIYLVN